MSERRTTGVRASRLLLLLVLLVGLIGLVAGLSACSGSSSDTTVASAGSTTTVAPINTTITEVDAIGTIAIALPDRAKLIETGAWGEVPADRISVIMAAGRTRADAEAVAEGVGGSVVGEIAYLNIYQIQTTGSSEADLKTALDKAAALEGVELAYPEQQLKMDEEIWGVRQSPLNDPAYSDDYGKGYALIGAQKAWIYMRGAGLPLSDVRVGVVDDGLYKDSGEFDGQIQTSYPDPGSGELKNPEQYVGPGGNVFNPNGSHGTAVAGIIGADPDNGGMTGVASNLGKKLTISVLNMYTAPYGSKVSTPDPADVTKYVATDGKTYVSGGLAAMLVQVQANAKVINCSFGADKPEEGNAACAAAYRRFFEKMAADHPDVIFVCAAGNESGKLSKTNYYPAGAASGLPNVITVGNVMNDGGEAVSSNTAGPEGEVTIAAPGTQAVRGVDPYSGEPVNDETQIGDLGTMGGGTSMAAPQVAAAAALLRSLNPKLTPERIKEILAETARPGPEGMGGGILAVDEAVLKVINEVREANNLPELTSEQLENMGVIDAVATSLDQPLTYSVRGILMAAPAEGTQVTITASEGCTVTGEVSQGIAAAGEVEWSIVTIKDEKASITVTRKDTGASSVISFTSPEFAGTYKGTMAFPLIAGLPDSEIQVPWEFTVDEDGHVEGGWDYARTDFTYTCSFTGQVAEDGRLIASGSGSVTISWAGNTKTDSGTLDLNGSITDGEFVGGFTASSDGSAFEVTAQRQ